MAAPLSFTRRARRDDLVAAAVRVIAREGIAAASVDRIAAEAGTSKGTALYHFGSKDELYAGVVAALFEAGRAYMTERIVGEPTPAARLRAYIESNLRFILENAEHVIATQRILQQGAPAVADDAIPPLRAMLESGQRDGEFGEFDPEVAALAIRAIIDGAAAHLPAHPELDGDHYVAEGVALVMRAVGRG